MTRVEEVEKLAKLARVDVPEAELEKYAAEFDAVLAYVSQLERLELPKEGERELPPLRNVMREDGEPTEPGTNTEKIAEQFPVRDGDALSVKQIITHE